MGSDIQKEQLSGGTIKDGKLWANLSMQLVPVIEEKAHSFAFSARAFFSTFSWYLPPKNITGLRNIISDLLPSHDFVISTSADARCRVWSPHCHLLRTILRLLESLPPRPKLHNHRKVLPAQLTDVLRARDHPFKNIPSVAVDLQNHMTVAAFGFCYSVHYRSCNK